MLHNPEIRSIIGVTERPEAKKGPKQPDVLAARQVYAGDMSTYITGFRRRSDDISITDWSAVCKAGIFPLAVCTGRFGLVESGGL